MPFPANPLDEDAALRAEEDRQKRAKAAVAGGPDLAKKVGSIHRLYPHITPGVALSLAKANASEATIKSVAEQEVKRMAAKAAQDNEPKGVFGRLGSWAKTGTRWATAGLALPYEALTNVASQAFTGEGGMDGFFISTSLGTMLADDEKAGSGFFIGGDAAKKQADRARRYRGTIGGQAWTFGRGAASLVAEPGTDAYRLLSGLVDAAAVIGGDPLNFAVPGASRIAGARKGLTKLGPTGRIMPLADEVVEGITGATKVARPKIISSVDEVARFSNELAATQKTSSTPELIDSIKRFTGGDWHNNAIQDKLRSGVAQLDYLKPDQNSLVTSDIANLDRLFETAKAIEEPVVVYRGIRGGSYLSTIKNATVGSTFDDAGFVSTTLNKEYAVRRAARDNGVMLEIVVPQGTKAISPLGLRADVTPQMAAGEAEVLLNRGLTFRVVEKTDDVVKVEIVTPSRATPSDTNFSSAGGVFETARQVNPMRAKSWLDSAQGQRVVEKLAGTRTLAETRKILPNVSIRTNLELTDAQTVDDVKSLLAGRLGLESGLVRASDIRYKSAFSGTPAVSERSRITRLFDKMPSRAISLRPSDRGIDEAVENIDRWLMSTGYKESERAPVVEEFARAMTGAMNPEERAARIASLQGAAESALDDQHRAAFQELLMLQDEATQISGRAVAEGFAVAEVQKLRQAYAASPVAVRGILTSREVRQGLQGIYGEAVRFMEAAGIALDQKTLLPRAKMKIGVKNVKNGFDRFGHRVGGETDFTRRLGSMADHRRRGWVGFGESTLDRGHGAYRGGTKKGLIPVDEAFTNANAAMSRQFDNIDDFVDQFIRYADIIDTLRPYFKNPAKPRIPRKMYGRAGELLDPPSLFASRMYEGISFDDLVEAAYDKEAAAKVQSKFFDNEIGMIVDDAAAGNIDEFADLTPDDVYAIWGNALAGTESDALRQARGLSTQIEETQARLADIESKFKSVGLAVRGTDRQALYDVAEKFRGMVREGLVRNGVDGDLADELLDSYYSNISEQSLYAIDESGNVTDFGFGKALLSDENGVLQPVGGVLASPGLRSEMLSRHLYLPDPRRVRRLQSRVGWVTGVKKSNPELAGELRLPAAMVEFIQQDVWRPLTLMTGGYILRNIAEAQARMTLLSRTSIFKHPIQHIMWAAGWKGAGDVMGRVYELDAPSRFLVRGQQRAEVAGIDDLMRESHGDYIDSIRNSYHKYGGDPLAAQQRAVRSGAFAAVSKTSRREYIQGYVDELRQLSDDPIAKMIAQGNDMEQVLNWLRTTADGRTHWSQINEMFESGVRFTDQNGVVRTVQASLLDERNLRNYIDRYIVGRLNLKAGEVGRLPDDVLRDVAAHGLVRNGDEVALTADEVKKLRPVFKSQTEGNVGNIFLVRREVARKGAKRVEKSVYGKVVSEDEAGVMRLVLMDEAWDANRNATPTFRRVMTDLLENPETGQLLPRMVKSEIRVSPGRFGRGGLNEAGRRTFQGMDTMVDKFFGGLFGKTTAYLDRSPLFRQRYWEQVETMLPVVDGAAVAALRDNVIEAATRLGVKPENYVGSKSLWKRMEAVPADRKGRVNLEQMDEYAKGHGLDAVKNELYNATDRNNLTDVARVIAPFGQAWGEILKTWVNLAASDPRILRRANVIVEGAKDADPDGDGRGFFYKDPVSGEYVFNYPMSDKFVALLTGPVSQALNKVPVLNRFGSDAGSVDAMLTAPVRSLNVGFTLTPGLGPMAQIPAALILRNIPKADEVKKILMPFGDPSLRGQAFMPAWFQKFTSGLWDTPNTTRLMGQTYVEVIQHLYTSGDYNVQDVNDRERMFEDAIGLARSLSVLRAFGQFMGPTRPTVEFQEADLPAAFYAAELRKLQDPEQGGDYDTAVANFLTLYPEAVAYVGSKTKSEYGGLDITEAFGKWEEDNGQILDRYKDIGGFFAPFDDTVDMAVWSRQLAAGKRTRNTAREVIEIAEYRAANSIYKKAAEAFPGTRTEDQRALLRNLRNVLSKKYPGFATLQMFDTQKFNRQVEQLRRATQDEDLQGNPVRDATAAYLDVRDQVLGVVESRGRSTTNGITSDKDDDLRAILRQYAESLVKKYPDFARLYDRILSREVESDTEPSGQ